MSHPRFFPQRPVRYPALRAPGATGCHATRTPSRVGRHRQRGGLTAVTAAFMLVLLVILSGIVAPGGLLLWEARSPSVVLAQGSAGTFHSATSSPGGFFTSTLTSIQTSVGTLTVTGTFSALRGSPLVVEAYNKSDVWQLCLAQVPHTCTPLAGTWSGRMVPTPAAAHATAFARHGLSTDNLESWLTFGVLGTLLSLLILAASTAVFDADDPPAPKEAP